MVALDFSRLHDSALMDLRDDIDSLSRPWRELAVLAECAGAPMATLAQLPLGSRDRLLLEVRAHLFGRRVDAEMRCDRCGERLDLSFDAGGMLGAADGSLDDRELVHGSMRLRLRLPDSTDVAAACLAPDAEDVMLSRCVDEPAFDVAALRDSDLRTAIAHRLAELDPQAELRLTSTCPACAATCDTLFDPAGFLLAEIVAYTDRLLSEVDQLARAYGWRESEILALGTRRRRRYLEMTS
jgi:hypothetical protein